MYWANIKSFLKNSLSQQFVVNTSWLEGMYYWFKQKLKRQIIFSVQVQNEGLRNMNAVRARPYGAGGALRGRGGTSRASSAHTPQAWLAAPAAAAPQSQGQPWCVGRVRLAICWGTQDTSKALTYGSSYVKLPKHEMPHSTSSIIKKAWKNAADLWEGFCEGTDVSD